MNEQAEYMLLGSILKDNSIIGHITISPEHFADLSNQNLFRAMLNIKRKGFPIDVASLKDELGENGLLFLGGEKRIQELKDCVPSVHAFQSYERMIINQYKLNASKDLINDALENFNLERLETLISELNKIDEEGTQEEFNLSNKLQQLYDAFMVETPKKRSGIPSGYVHIDNKTDGFRPGNLVIIGARPSIGKTAFIINMAINAAVSVKAIPIIFSLEMIDEELLKRMVSCVAEINGLKMKNPYHYTNNAEKEKGVKALGIIEKMNIQIYDKPAQKVSEMKAKIRKIKHDYPDREVIVFIDYLTLIKPQKEMNSKHAEVTEISADLKNMAKEFNCPVVCLAQLSRGVESRDDKRPRMSDLRESGSIEQDADIIMLLYRDEYYNKEKTAEEDKGVLEVDIAKNRDGEVGLVKLKYKKEINKIEHYSK